MKMKARKLFFLHGGFAFIYAAAFICALALFIGASHVFALEPDDILPDAELEARARAISAELRCPVCQNQSIDDSDAPLAKDIRLFVRDRLLAGDDDSQIKALIVARYGEYALLKPVFSPKNALLWLAPAIFFMLGIAVFWRVFRPFRKN